MLSQENNEILTRVGPGTPIGNLLRRFWIPGLLEQEIVEPDGAPVKLRLLEEDLVAFRSTSGKVGIVDAYCAHRRGPMCRGRGKTDDSAAV
jgi:phenylpropionate dioxygenase-like ring-hydroxylating dioxygenase large terminal subunit